jgi:general secretion pathway protein D
MIKIYVSALLVVLMASAQAAYAEQGMEDVFAQLDAANSAGQADGESADAEAVGAGQEAEMFDRLFEKGVARYEEGSFDEAILIFDAVLAINQYHAGAISYKKRAAKGVYSREDRKKKGARVQALAEIEAAWNAEPKVFGTVKEYEVEAMSDPDQEAVDQVIARLKATKIPVFDMAEATVEEVVQFFAETSRKESGAGEDVDILLVGMEGAEAENNITVSVNGMSLYEALQYVVEMASLKFEIRQNLVIIMPANYVPASKMVMNSYDVIPEVGSDLEAAADSAGGESDLFDSPAVDSVAGPIDVSGFFALVEFPEGTSAVYQPRFHKLFVKNTPSNLKAVEAVLADLSEEAVKRRSQQVEIETKFVEFSEGALAELGFDWTVYGSGSIAGMTMDDTGAYFKESSGYQQAVPVANGAGLGGSL